MLLVLLTCNCCCCCCCCAVLANPTPESDPAEVVRVSSRSLYRTKKKVLMNEFPRKNERAIKIFFSSVSNYALLKRVVGFSRGVAATFFLVLLFTAAK